MNEGDNKKIQVNDDRLVIPKSNNFINGNTKDTNLYQETAINNSNNTPKAPIDYSQDPVVKEKMKRKDTVNVSNEDKIMILIGIIIFIFILLLPTIYSYLN